MTVLDDARRIAEAGAPEYGGDCVLCRLRIEGDAYEGHAPDCPWLSMPRIVAALEADVDAWAELAACYPDQEGRGGAAWATRIHARNIDYDDALYLIELTHIARQGIAATATLETDAAR